MGTTDPSEPQGVPGGTSQPGPASSGPSSSAPSTSIPNPARDAPVGPAHDPSPGPTLDAASYPHLLDLIFAYAPPSSLLALRGASHSLRDRADGILARHILVFADGRVASRLAPRGRLPLLPIPLHPSTAPTHPQPKAKPGFTRRAHPSATTSHMSSRPPASAVILASARPALREAVRVVDVQAPHFDWAELRDLMHWDDVTCPCGSPMQMPARWGAPPHGRNGGERGSGAEAAQGGGGGVDEGGDWAFGTEEAYYSDSPAPSTSNLAYAFTPSSSGPAPPPSSTSNSASTSGAFAAGSNTGSFASPSPRPFGLPNIYSSPRPTPPPLPLHLAPLHGLDLSRATVRRWGPHECWVPRGARSLEHLGSAYTQRTSGTEWYIFSPGMPSRANLIREEGVGREVFTLAGEGVRHVLDAIRHPRAERGEGGGGGVAGGGVAGGLAEGHDGQGEGHGEEEGGEGGGEGGAEGLGLDALDDAAPEPDTSSTSADSGWDSSDTDSEDEEDTGLVDRCATVMADFWLAIPPEAHHTWILVDVESWPSWADGKHLPASVEAGLRAGVRRRLTQAGWAEGKIQATEGRLRFATMGEYEHDIGAEVVALEGDDHGFIFAPA